MSASRMSTQYVAIERDVLGLKHLFTFGSLVFFDLDGVRLFLSTPENGEWQPSSVLYPRPRHPRCPPDARWPGRHFRVRAAPDPLPRIGPGRVNGLLP